MELHPPAPFCGDRYHLVAIDIHEETDNSRRSANDLIAWANARGAVVFSCHPYWCGRNSHDLMLLEGTIGTEVCNYGCEIEIGRGISRVHWDEILERKGQAFGLAVDDSHSSEQIGGGWVMLSCEKRTPAAVKKALREGRFYSSMGPEIRSMKVLPAEPVKDKPARRIEVACSPAEHVVFYGPRWRGRAFHGAPGRPLTSAAFTWTDEQYIRVEVLDERGRAAWTNALFLSPDSPGGWRI
jgi:hypothetical protein